MADLLRALVLGIIQGLTEFLPVSSSGHLELAKYLLHDHSIAEESLLMTVTLHFATALSTIVVFRKEIWVLIKGLFAFKWNRETRFSVNILISMIPAAAVGLLFEEEIEALFNKNILLVSAMLVVTGLLLLFADRARHTDKSVGPWQAILIGISQAIAILPGISRSGATISTSVLLRVDRRQAASFSFLMVVPLIIGKMGKDMLDGALFTHDHNVPALVVGFLAAFFSGLLACRWMVLLVQRAKLSWFAVYCFVVATIAIILYLWF
ncbi:MAG: undecaprenyl-diphosphate phosphatase [Saprospirales bacterium]|nr:undecaprenyl-diphosphate phosphatase [Saprospirales bacterium]MBK8490506.1 undecaprenyl-diphosphate phosphatase [Saprospirales bacterium]